VIWAELVPVIRTSKCVQKIRSEAPRMQREMPLMPEIDNRERLEVQKIGQEVQGYQLNCKYHSERVGKDRILQLASRCRPRVRR
jgi:hypothetical protein